MICAEILQAHLDISGGGNLSAPYGKILPHQADKLILGYVRRTQ